MREDSVVLMEGSNGLGREGIARGTRPWRAVFGIGIPVGIIVLVALLMQFFGVVRD